jgi:hypothetical protein
MDGTIDVNVTFKQYNTCLSSPVPAMATYWNYSAHRDAKTRWFSYLNMLLQMIPSNSLAQENRGADNSLKFRTRFRNLGILRKISGFQPIFPAFV